MGWPVRLKKQVGIHSFVLHGEDGSVHEASMMLGRLASYIYKIYNMDGAGLFFRFGPACTIGTMAGAGTKSKGHVTVNFLVSTSGSDKRKPVTMGKTARLRSFGKVFDSSIYCDHLYNKKACMANGIFNWYCKNMERCLETNLHS